MLASTLEVETDSENISVQLGGFLQSMMNINNRQWSRCRTVGFVTSRLAA